METRSVADIAGPWVDPEFDSSLIQRCRTNWAVPVGEISNYALSTFIRQGIALALLIPEAKRRLVAGFTDGTELYDEELANALAAAVEA